VPGKASSISVLSKHVDGLEVSVFGEPIRSVYQELRSEKRTLGASPRGLREFGSVSGVPGGPMMLTTDGGGSYQFVLRNGAISRLEVTSRGNLPNVMIQFGAEVLQERSLEEVDAVVEALAGRFLEPGFRTKVSSFHLALDFQCADWQWPEFDDIVCRSRKESASRENKVASGITFGKKRAPLQVQIYDKSLDIRIHRRGKWMENVWAQKETYHKRLPVIRVELRFARGLLREFGVETIADLRSGLGDLINHAVGGTTPWFRVCSVGTRGHRPNRRPVDPLWQEIAQALIEGMPETGRVRARSPSASPDLRRDCRTHITYAVRTAAWTRVSGQQTVKPPEQVLEPVALRHLPAWLEARDFASWDEAVDFEVKKLVVSGQVPYASAPDR
jgi:hypothetical protein